MKIKHLALLVAMLLCGISAYAEQPQSKADKTVEFRPYWDLQLQGGAGYTIGEASFGDLVSPAVYLSTNYRFHHAMGIRLGLGGYQGKGAVLTNATNVYSFNFLQLNADYKLDLTSLIGGFNHKRVCSVYVFAGAGLNYGFNNKQAAELKPVVDAYHNEDTMPYLWNSKLFVAGRFGLGLDFRVSDMVTLNLEGNSNILCDHFNSKRAADRNVDWQFNLLAGVSVSFGKKYDVSKKWLAEEEARKAAELAAAEAEAARIAAEKAAAEEAARKAAEAEAARIAAEKAAAEKAAAERAANIKENSQDIFFTIGSSTIRKTELAKLETLAAWLEAHPDYSVSIVGYADKDTGTSAGNMRLSERRAENVKKQLVANGVAEGRIVMNHKGDTVQPYEKVLNRVVICTLE